jgi:chaperonin GroES
LSKYNNISSINSNRVNFTSIIILSGTATEKPSQGVVIAVGPGKKNNAGEVNPVGVNAGDIVIFGQYGGSEVKIDGQEYLILSESDIFGVIES